MGALRAWQVEQGGWGGVPNASWVEDHVRLWLLVNLVKLVGSSHKTKKVTLGAVLVPGVDSVSSLVGSSLVGSGDVPVWLDDAAPVLGSAAVAAVVELWVVEISLSVDNVHVARGGSEALGRSTVSVVGSVGSVNSEGLLGPTVVPVARGLLMASQRNVHVLLEGLRKLVWPRLWGWVGVSKSS